MGAAGVSRPRRGGARPLGTAVDRPAPPRAGRLSQALIAEARVDDSDLVLTDAPPARGPIEYRNEPAPVRQDRPANAPAPHRFRESARLALGNAVIAHHQIVPVHVAAPIDVRLDPREYQRTSHRIAVQHGLGAKLR